MGMSRSSTARPFAVNVDWFESNSIRLWERHLIQLRLQGGRRGCRGADRHVVFQFKTERFQWRDGFQNFSFRLLRRHATAQHEKMAIDDDRAQSFHFSQNGKDRRKLVEPEGGSNPVVDGELIGDANMGMVVSAVGLLKNPVASCRIRQGPAERKRTLFKMRVKVGGNEREGCGR